MVRYEIMEWQRGNHAFILYISYCLNSHNKHTTFAIVMGQNLVCVNSQLFPFPSLRTFINLLFNFLFLISPPRMKFLGQYLLGQAINGRRMQSQGNGRTGRIQEIRSIWGRIYVLGMNTCRHSVPLEPECTGAQVAIIKQQRLRDLHSRHSFLTSL